jgi:hypothetical protein
MPHGRRAPFVQRAWACRCCRASRKERTDRRQRKQRDQWNQRWPRADGVGVLDADHELELHQRQQRRSRGAGHDHHKFTGRIVVNASLDVERTSGNGDVNCQLWIGPPGTFSQLTFARIGNPYGDAFVGLNGTLYEVSIPLTAAAVKPAGSYAIEATCQTGSAASFIAGDIAAVAAAQ